MSAIAGPGPSTKLAQRKQHQQRMQERQKSAPCFAMEETPEVACSPIYEAMSSNCESAQQQEEEQTEEESTWRRRRSTTPWSSAFSSGWKSTAFKVGALAVAASVAVTGAAAQGLPSTMNGLRGTWSSGSGAVQTGLNFYNPGNGTFNAPSSAGQSYSFTSDGHWEQALYLYENNPSNPGCVQAQLIWQHGTYTLNRNGSLTLSPFKGDGKQQLSTRCGHTSNIVQSYSQQEYMQGFDIQIGVHYGNPAYYLQLYEFDGTPKPFLWQIYNPPQMLPTSQLHLEIIGSPAD